MAELKQALPAGTKLVSFDLAHHLFVFHYNDEIPVVDWPSDAADPRGAVPYFCVDSRWLELRPLPFAWETVRDIPCVRKRTVRVVVGRRTDLPAAAPRSPALSLLEGSASR